MHWKITYLSIHWSVCVCLVPITTISWNLVVWHRLKTLNIVGISQGQTGDMNSTTALNKMRCQAEGLPYSTGHFHDNFPSMCLVSYMYGNCLMHRSVHLNRMKYEGKMKTNLTLSNSSEWKSLLIYRTGRV